LIALFALLAMAPAFAADRTAEAFLRTIYGKPYIGKHAKGVEFESRAQLLRYFTPAVTDLIEADEAEAAKHQDVPTLDGDPFIGAQDWEIARFDIAVRAIDADHASATVRFDNLGDHRTVLVTLVRAKSDWRIDDVDWGGDAGTLRGLYKPAPKH
jgi:hypothetical protein